ncbi:ankyrin repeat domain-containing protein [Bacteroidota bacterium]
MSNLFAQNDNELFWKAAKSNDVETLKNLLEKGVDVNVTTEYGATALTYASDKGHLESTVFLLENGADPNMKDLFYQSTPFIWTLYKGNIDITKSMIKHGADVNDQDAINWIARNGDIDLINLMLEKGSTGAGLFLYSSIKNNNLELSKVILEKAEINQENLTSCLLLATALENIEAASFLKENGAKLPERKEGKDIGKSLENFTGFFEGPDGNVKVNKLDNLLAITFGTRPYKLIYKDSLIFTFLEYPDLTITFSEIESQIMSLEFRQGDYTEKYIKVDEPAIIQEEVTEQKPLFNDNIGEITQVLNWPSFRGIQASGVADGQYPPIVWNINEKTNLKWKTYIPGLAHACPIIWEDKVFIITAIGSDTTAEYRVGLFGDVEPADDNSNHVWKIYCLDKKSGNINWEKKAYEGVPKVKRHTKATQANSTPVTNGEFIVALYGSEGMVCYDMDGNEQWRKDLGILDAGWFFDEATQWGHSSSPIIYKNTVIVQCDRSKDSYIAAYDLATGNEVWRTERDEISSWGTPTIYYGEKHDELITHATKGIRGYDPNTGEELWKLGPNSEVTVSTPVVYNDLIFVTAGYPPVRPVYAIKPGGKGDISIADSLNSGVFIQWRTLRGGTYMPSPIAYNGYFYTLANNGLLTCYDIITGEQKYRERISGGAFTASIIAADGKLYCTSEEQGVFVIKAGPEFEILISNLVGEICMATPAISEGMIFIRGQHHIFCVGR